jgi:hypothetical protein
MVSLPAGALRYVYVYARNLETVCCEPNFNIWSRHFSFIGFNKSGKMYMGLNIDAFLAYLPKAGIYNLHLFVCLCIPSPSINFWMPEPIFIKLFLM